MKTAITRSCRSHGYVHDLRDELRDPLDQAGDPGRGLLGVPSGLHGRGAARPHERPDRALRAPARCRRRPLSALTVQELRRSGGRRARRPAGDRRPRRSPARGPDHVRAGRRHALLGGRRKAEALADPAPHRERAGPAGCDGARRPLRGRLDAALVAAAARAGARPRWWRGGRAALAALTARSARSTPRPRRGFRCSRSTSSTSAVGLAPRRPGARASARGAFPPRLHGPSAGPT